MRLFSTCLCTGAFSYHKQAHLRIRQASFSESHGCRQIKAQFQVSRPMHIWWMLRSKAVLRALFQNLRKIFFNL